MVRKKIKILFVCTGNIFRSMSAEYLFKKYLKDNKLTRFEVSSAGIIAKKQKANLDLVEKLSSLGISISKHKQRKLTKKILDESDIVIAMDKTHFDFIKQKFNYHSILYNLLAIGEESSVLDIDSIKNFEKKPLDVKKHIQKTVIYLNKTIPNLYKNLEERFYLFEDAASGKRTHRNGYPFIILHKTKNTVSFFSIDIPKYEDGHILIIPKKRYRFIEEIPPTILHELIEHISLIGIAVKKHHFGYNILLNNGQSAGQYIFHTHFHLIPRNFEDQIKIEVWKKQKISIKKFIEYNKKIEKEIKLIKSKK